MGSIMSLFTPAGLRALLLSLPAVLLALSFHEFCHGWVAYKLGDMTAAREGRLSLNPLSHLDPLGTFCLIFFHLGWAKPVPINSRYFKNPRRDIALVSLAGAAGNFLLAFICGALIRIAPGFFMRDNAIMTLMLNMLYINIGLGVFNLIPIPPLDGSKILAVFLPVSALRGYFLLERWGMLIIFVLFLTNIIPMIMAPITNLMLNLVLFSWI